MINMNFIIRGKEVNFSDLEWISVLQNLVNVIPHEERIAMLPVITNKAVCPLFLFLFYP